MRLFCILLFAVPVILAAEDAWNKVKELKTGTEVRVLKKGSTKPLIGTFDEANDERLVIVIKNEQLAVEKADIDRFDFRPARTSGRVTKETKHRTGVDGLTAPKGAPTGTEGLDSSSSTNVIIGSKPDFETLYRRRPVAPK